MLPAYCLLLTASHLLPTSDFLLADLPQAAHILRELIEQSPIKLFQSQLLILFQKLYRFAQPRHARGFPLRRGDPGHIIPPIRRSEAFEVFPGLLIRP